MIFLSTIDCSRRHETNIYADPALAEQYTFYQPFYQTNNWVKLLYYRNKRNDICVQAVEGLLDKEYITETQMSGVSPYAVIHCNNGMDPSCHIVK